MSFWQWLRSFGQAAPSGRTYGEFLDVTPEEDAAVAKHIAEWDEHARVGESPSMQLFVHDEVYRMIVAQGLWEYASELLEHEWPPAEHMDKERRFCPDSC